VLDEVEGVQPADVVLPGEVLAPRGV